MAARLSAIPPDLEGLLALSPATCADFRDVCARARYSEATLARISSVPRGSQGLVIPLVRRALLRGTSEEHTYAAGVLALLFACQDDVSETTVREIMGEALTDALLASALIGRSTIAGSVCSNFIFVPLDGLWLTGDHVANGVSAVMPPGPTTGELIGVMPDHVSGRVLDVGCGPGSLALVAARRGARWVTGVDINPRAVRMAEFNARFNGFDNVTFTVGDLTEPVQGDRFELVVAQPPFVMQPPDTAPITFVHGGPTGETITHRILGALGDVLVPGGRALILAQTPSRPEPPHQRFRRDLATADIDVVVLTMPGTSAPQQALHYATLEAPEGGVEYAAAVARYADHLEALDIHLMTHVLIVARARDPDAQPASHRFSATLPIKGLSTGNGGAIDVLLASLDLASVDDATLARAKLRTSLFARWIEERTGPDPALEPTRSVRFEQGRFATEIDNLSEVAYRLAGLIDTAETLEHAAREYSSATGLDSSTGRAQTLRFAREALGRGLLEINQSAAS